MATGLTLPRQALTLGAVDPSVPTTVRTADGRSYTIPSGPIGSYPWVREASLIAVAYHQLGDATHAYQWNREYDKRRALWDHVQAGEDLQAILNTMPGDWLTRPIQIIQDVLGGAVQTVGDAAGAVIDWAKWLPWLLAGGIAVVGLGLFKGTLRAKVTR